MSALPVPDPMSVLAIRWREDAAMFRQRGQETLALMTESFASELEAALHEYDQATLTLKEASAESGYSYSALQKLVVGGELQNVGDKHRPRVRRGDLPRKARQHHLERLDGEPDLAGRILATRS